MALATEEGGEFYKKHPKEAKELARIAYFNFVPEPRIAEGYGIPYRTLHSWAIRNDNWNGIRKQIYTESIRVIIECQKENLQEILGLTLDNVKRGLAALSARQEVPDAAEMKQLIEIYEVIKKDCRLEAGEATEIFKKIDTSPEGVKAFMEEVKKIDPYVNYEQ